MDPITVTDPRGIALLAAIAGVYLGIRLLPRLIAGWGCWISAAKVHEQLEQGAGALLVLDVRSPAEYAAETGHIPGARNLPVEHIRGQLHSLEDWFSGEARQVVLVCRTDTRAAFAARMLKHVGFYGVRVMSGGMDAWTDEGYEVEIGNGPA